MVQGFLCYGIPLGDDEYIQTVLQSKARTIADTIHKCVNLLGDGYKQDLWCLIRSSLQMKFSYWNQLCFPQDVATSQAATTVDEALWKATCAAMGLNADVLGALQGEDERTLRRRIQLPLKLKGLGLRSTEDPGIAFLGAIAQAVPQFCRANAMSDDPHGIATHLRETVGEELLDSDTPMAPLMRSGTPTGAAYTKAVDDVKQLLQN